MICEIPGVHNAACGVTQPFIYPTDDENAPHHKRSFPHAVHPPPPGCTGDGVPMKYCPHPQRRRAVIDAFERRTHQTVVVDHDFRIPKTLGSPARHAAAVVNDAVPHHLLAQSHRHPRNTCAGKTASPPPPFHRHAGSSVSWPSPRSRKSLPLAPPR